eukprot:UN14028
MRMVKIRRMKFVSIVAIQLKQLIDKAVTQIVNRIKKQIRKKIRGQPSFD